MASEVNSDLESFHEFVSVQIEKGEADLSPEEALALWRERRETIASVQRGLADVEAGRTRPAQEVLNELRNELRD